MGFGTCPGFFSVAEEAVDEYYVNACVFVGWTRQWFQSIFAGHTYGCARVLGYFYRQSGELNIFFLPTRGDRW